MTINEWIILARLWVLIWASTYQQRLRRYSIKEYKIDGTSDTLALAPVPPHLNILYFTNPTFQSAIYITRNVIDIVSIYKKRIESLAKLYVREDNLDRNIVKLRQEIPVLQNKLESYATVDSN